MLILEVLLEGSSIQYSFKVNLFERGQEDSQLREYIDFAMTPGSLESYKPSVIMVRESGNQAGRIMIL